MSGDGARRDADGYLWITGRVDDMLNCSGKYINTYLLCTDFRSTESYASGLLIEIKKFTTTWFLRDIENRNTILFFLIFEGHLMSTAQVESALVEHKNVAEAAVVAAPHKVKGKK